MMKPSILFFLFLASLVSSILASFSGNGTVYTSAFANPDGGSGFNCGFRWLPSKARTYFAALNAPQYNSSANCGRCASVKCTDSRCQSNQTLTIMISTFFSCFYNFFFF